MVIILHLVWDPGNVAHIFRHGVTIAEADEICHGDPVELHSYLGRVILIGRTSNSRMLAVVLEALEDPGTYYVVTARSASRKERRYYQLQREGRSS